MARGKSTLQIELKATVSQYQQALRQAAGATDSVEQGLKRVERAGAGLAPVSVHIRRVGLSAESADAGTKKLGGGIDRLHKGATGLESGMSGVADGISGVTTIMESGATASADTAVAFASIGSAASTAAIPAVKNLGRGLAGIKGLISGAGKAASGDLLGGLAKATKGAGGLGTGISNLVTKLGGMKGVLIGGGLIAGVGALAVGIREVEQAAQAKRLDEFWNALKRGQEVSDATLDDLLLVGAAWKGLDVALREAATNAGLVGAERFVRLAEEAGLPAPQLQKLRRELAELRPELSDTASATDALTEALDRQKSALQAQTDPIFAAIDASLRSQEAKNAETEAQARLTEAQNAGDPQAVADAELALQSAHINAAKAAIDEKGAQDTLNVGLSTGQVRVDALEAQLTQLEAQGYGSSASAAYLRDRIAELKSKNINLTTTGFGAATDAARNLYRALSSLPESKTIRLGFTSFGIAELNRFQAVASATGRRQHGGPVHRNRLYEVAEGGAAELLHMSGRSYLIPGSEGHVTPAGPMTPAIATGAAGGAIYNDNRHVTYEVRSNNPTAVVEAIKRYERRNGPGWRK